MNGCHLPEDAANGLILPPNPARPCSSGREYCKSVTGRISREDVLWWLGPRALVAVWYCSREVTELSSEGTALKGVSSALRGGRPLFLCVTSTHVDYKIVSIISASPHGTTYRFSRQNASSAWSGRVTTQMLPLTIHTSRSDMRLSASRRPRW